jgi:hypothetical protein
MIAYDTGGYAYSGASTTATVNLAATGTDRIAFIFAFVDSTTQPTVTVGGSSTGVTFIGSINLTGNQTIHVYYYLAPPTSSTAYVCTQANAYIDLKVVTYTGASQTGVPDSYASKTGDTTPLDLTTTVVASDCWLVSGGRNYSTGVIVPSTGTTERAHGTTNAILIGDSNGAVGTGAQTMNWTNGGSGNTGGIIVSFKPAGGASVNSNFLAFM